MAIRISMGHIDEYDEQVAAYAKQLGLRSVQLHNPSNLAGAEGHWSYAELLALRQRCEADGLALEGLENVPAAQFDKIQRGEAGRDEQIEQFRTTLRNMSRAGINLLGYNFLVTYVWRTDMTASGRGGARVSAFDLADIERGNALASYKLSPPDPATAIDAQTMWDNHQYFLDAVLPVAEEVGVRLALHPDDPPVDTPLGGAARIFISPAAIDRALTQSRNSPSWGLNLCLGTVSEMGGQAAVDAVIDRLGPLGKVFYVHFRDVSGQVPAFAECFLGEGNLDVAAVVKRLHDTGFDSFLIDDHVPAIIGDRDTWADTSPDAYCSRGRAHAIGYLQGTLDALRLTPRSTTAAT
jgi:mannonate dehydratase